MKPRVAVCFSGLMRTFSQCYPQTFKAIIEPYEADVFMYVPIQPDAKQIAKQALCYPKLQACTFFAEHKLDEKTYVTASRHNPIQGTLRLLKYLKCVEALKREYEVTHNFRYDWVFRCRCDAYMLPTHPLEDLHTLTQDRIYIPNHNHAGGLNDRFAFGPSHLMRMYHHRIDHLDAFHTAGGLVHSERFLRAFIERFSIPLGQTQVRVELWRTNGSKKCAKVRGEHLPYTDPDKAGKWNLYEGNRRKNKK